MLLTFRRQMETSTGSNQDLSDTTPSTIMDMESTMENKTMAPSCVDDQVSTPSILQTGIFFALAFITVTLNLVFILAVLKTKRLRTKTNCILVSMAGADLLVGLISEPIWGLALWIDDEDHKYQTAAKFFAHFLLTSSVWHLLVVTLERTIAALKPLHYRPWVTCRRVQVTLAIIWLWSLFVAALHPFVWSRYSYYLFIVWTGFLVLVFMLVLHCMMLQGLKQATRSLQQFSSSTNRYDRNQEITELASVKNARLREKRKTKLVKVITLAFAICVSPSVVTETLCYVNAITQVVKNFINLLFFLNSFTKPIIFAICVKRFRKAVKAMCGCPSKLTTASANGSRDTLQLPVSPSGSDTSYFTFNYHQASSVNL